MFVLLATSAFFSSSETALMSINKIKIRNMVDEGVKGAELVVKLIEDPGKLLSVILVGNNLVNIGASALATSLAIGYFGNAGVGIATGIMTFLLLVFAEITPKSLAAVRAEMISLKVAKFLYYITLLLTPVVIVLTFITNNLIKLLGVRPEAKKPLVTEEELKTIVNVGHEEGILESEERQMIHNVFEFGDLYVKDIITPRTDLVSFSVKASYEEVVEVIKREQYSRYPVYKKNIDNIVGVLHVKDLIFFDIDKDNFSITDYARAPYFTYEYKHISLLFEEMRKGRMSIAVVLDEYGGTAGVVTIEDLVEEIVGDISDEYDNPVKAIELIKDNQYLVQGSTGLDLINGVLGINIRSECFDSIGGFVMGLFGRMPDVGEAIEYNGIKFTVDKVGRNRITAIKITIM
ncbi:CNNM domain-containing protein [Desulfofalx alkaliphila]|uniref:CNNM domain-containing protein n=1 Tax=Desulfofalx alkaliphila TaxID=105483 RepID=UPI0004E23E66